jgi:hypothetical protein
VRFNIFSGLVYAHQTLVSNTYASFVSCTNGRPALHSDWTTHARDTGKRHNLRVPRDRLDQVDLIPLWKCAAVL